MTEWKRSVCPYDCPDACGLLVKVEEGRAARVKGDPEHPFTQGLLCPKMDRYERTVHSPQRLRTPQVRCGPKGQGKFRSVNWEEAIGHIADRWRQILADEGGQAILPCSYAGTMGLVQRNAGHAFFYRLGASRLLRTLCSPAKDAGWKSIMGDTAGPHPDEVQRSDFILLWGSNALATNLHLYERVRRAKAAGAEVWLVDTYTTPTAVIADRVIHVRPGSDGALVLGMLHMLEQHGLWDESFIHHHVHGMEELRAHVLPRWTAEAAAQVCGVPPELISQLADRYGRAAAPFISIGSGLSRYGNGALTVRTILLLPAAVGAWGKPGGGALTGISTGAAFCLADVITKEEWADPATRSVNINQLGQALTELEEPPIRSLYVYHCNPAAVLPDQNKVLAGLAREDLFTVVHERFMTDTARYADVLLPATSSLEHDDLYRSYGNYCVQRAAAAIPPVGEAKSNWQVFGLLAQAMGLADPFFQQSAQELVEELIATGSPWLRQVDQEALWAGKAVELPLPEGYKCTFRTPSQRIEVLREDLDPKLPDYRPPRGGPGRYWLMTAPAIHGLNSSFAERPDLIDCRTGGRMTLAMNPAAAAEEGLREGQLVQAVNEQGAVDFYLHVTEKVPAGVVVAEGVWWQEQAPGNRTVNALTSQHLTDGGEGSTFYDTKVDVKAR